MDGLIIFLIDWLIIRFIKIFQKNINPNIQSQMTFFFSVLMYKDSFLQQRQQIFSVKELEQENVRLFVFVVQ